MKSYKRVLLAAGVVGALSLAGCKKNNFEDPFNSFAPETAFTTPDRIEKASVGMYDQLQNANFYGGWALIFPDIRGIDATPSTYFGQMALYNTLLATDGTVAGAYRGAYRTIYESNLFLKYFVPNSDKVSAEKANQYVGEAKFIRSLVYFSLVNLWAQPYSFTADASHPGVPLVLDAADDPFAPANQIARSSVAEVYSQIEADLLDAESKLPARGGSSDFSSVARATKGAAQALLARLYLYKGDWPKAAQYADLVINSGDYDLNASPELTFGAPYTTVESIFSVAHNGGDNPNTNNSIGQHYGAGARGDIPVFKDYIDLMEPTDLRRVNLTEEVSGAFWTTKYSAGTTDWVPVLRYAEILLIKAEALARQAAGVDATAVGLVNEIRERSEATPVAPATKQDLIDAILLERRIELAFEGQGSFDFLRTGRDIPAHGVVSAQAWGNNYMVLPIPKYDTDKNPNLVQNPGY